MTRALRLVLFFLLVSMQILAPWVHAHTGTETGGFLHWPGLESLAKIGKACEGADRPHGVADVIIGMQVGVPDSGQVGQSSPDGLHHPPILLPMSVSLVPPLSFAGHRARVETPPPRFRFSRHDFASRAPPKSPRLF